MKYILLLLLIAFNSIANDAFISPAQLFELQKDKKLIILDVSSYSSYNTSHIEGASYVNMSKLVESKYSGLLISFSDIVQRELVRLGVNEDSKVVIYSRNTDENQLHASYLALVLINYGFENVTILDGGYMAWVFEYNLLVSSTYSSSTNSGNFKIKENKNLLVNTDYLKKNLFNSQFIDSRESSKFDSKSGHITSAKSHYYRDNFFDDLTIKSDATIEKNFITRLNLKKNEEVIVYGDTIFDASMNWYILYKKFGFINAKIYKESFSAWAAENLPISVNENKPSVK